ncbi:MAG: helix-turn-helix domain-containing protein [Phycisphaerales bacterium]|jgi:ribosome-binding protein aMBF1 (putative translation factor)|nr:helix-turn-helix domain-containing protein [Phycisphaerales bacterium]
MIRNETEYQQAVARVDAERKRFAEHVEAWKKQGFTADQIGKLREPLESFHMQLVEEVQSYERLKRGQFSEFENLHGLGQVLIGLRIARAMTQRELARRLNVDETAVSRDERNEYHGITVDRAKKVLDALGVRLVTRVEVEPLHTLSDQPPTSMPELAH